MSEKDLSEPRVTVVVVPRERFSCALDSLDSIIEYTTIPYKLVYVDGGSPPQIRGAIADKVKEHGFQMVRKDYYLSPNSARNTGLREVTTKYVVFCDNDVFVTRGWLKNMVDCAEQTGAAVVTPLTCQYKPIHEVIHCSGGVAGFKEETIDGVTKRTIIDQIHNQGKKVKDLRKDFKRSETKMAEFHCVLARTNIFEKIGPLDENMLNTKEHVDFSYLVMSAGEKIYFEPDSLVTYVPGPPLKWYDLHFYMLRWSDAWELHSLRHLIKKYNLTEDEYFKNRFRNRGWRRKMTIIRPLVKGLHWRIKRILENTLFFFDRGLNKIITSRYERHQGKLN